MNKIITYTSLYLCLVLFGSGCSNVSSETKYSPGNPNDSLAVSSPQNTGMDENSKTQNSVVSLTEKEAEQRMAPFVKQNKGKYVDYGEIENISSVGGNFTNDGALDYFFSVEFNDGSDYGLITNFFYNSDHDKISQLSINYPKELSNDWRSVTAKELKEGVIIGTAEFFGAFSGEHNASRSVKAEFTIDGNSINFDKKYLPQFLKAKQEIQNDLDKMQ